MTRADAPRENNPRPVDPPRIGLGEDHEVRFWTQRFGVDEPRLRDLVRRFGVSPRDIDDALASDPPRSRIDPRSHTPSHQRNRP